MSLPINSNSALKVVYVVPPCASQSPASGDGNLLGNHVKVQDDRNATALRILARGSDNFFPVFVVDAGYQTFGNITRAPEEFLDFHEMATQENAIR